MKNRTFFSDLAMDHPHFILAGHTDDRCCNDALQLTSMEYELHRHLKEEDYDAVVFYNRSQRVYCYDYRSYRLFCNVHCEDTAPAAPAAPTTPTAPSPSFIDLTADGPLGAEFEEDELPAAPSAPTAPTAPAAPAGGGNQQLSNRAINTNAFWAQMEAMFRSDKKVALVLSNMNSMINVEHETGDFSVNALNTLLNLGKHAGHNKSIAIYVFRGLDFACLEQQLRGEGDEWGRFVNSCLLPLLDQNNTGTKTSNHVIHVDYPNAAEIRNLLLHLRFREEHPLNIREADVEKIALKLANRCSSDTLNNLINKIERYIRENPEHRVTLKNCHNLIFEPNCNTAMQELDAFIGLKNLKTELQKIYKVAKHAGARTMEMPVHSSRFTPRTAATNLSHTLNVCLLGEPGTGKTAVATILGRIYYEAGVLPTAHVEAVKPSEILSSGIGSSGRAMEERIRRALGGVLFIDEAYGLSQANAGNAGLEALNQLVARMSDYEGQFAVVLAGYEKEIPQLLSSNPGLQSRFLTSRYFRLAPYSWQEMRDILLRMAEKQNATFRLEKLSPDEIREVRAIIPSKNSAVQNIGSEYGRIWLDNFCENWVGDRGLNWGNAREAGNLLEEMKQNFAVRIKQDDLSSVGKFEFTPIDIPADRRVHLKPRSKGLDEALDNLSKLIGLGPAKNFLKNLCGTIRWDNQTGAPGNYLFIGPPGTGKTYFAEHMAEILNHLHVLRRRSPLMINASDLIHRLHPTPGSGGSRESLTSIVMRARGGMLFIDEAHQLKDSDAGRRIIRELVPIIENPEIRSDTCFVLAGYQDEMVELLSVDAGLESRFPSKNHIKFVNYTPDELARILAIFAREKGYIPTEGYLNRTRNALNRYLDNVDHHFGNARFMRSVYLEESIKRRTKRLNKTHLLNLREDEREYAIPEEAQVQAIDNVNRLEETDIPESMDGYAGPLGMPLLPYRNSEARLGELVGKEKIKDYVRAYKKSAGIPEFFDSNTGGGMHFVITGPPGVGRHTVAQVLASMLFEMGKLDNERPINRSKGDFEAQYVGQTVAQTRRVLSGATGNMLIVNSPSSMVPKSSSDNTFGTEALATIVGAMSSCHNISMVFIDTPEGMDAVIKSVNGLRDRAVFFEIEALSPMEMHEIFLKKTENSYCFDSEIEELLPSFFLNWVSDRGGLGDKRSAWGNGSEIEALIKQLEMNWNRLGGEKRTVDGFPKRLITREIFPEELRKYLKNTKVNHETALRELMEMTGLGSVKTAISKIQRRLSRADKSCTIPGCYCFVGNPGTGKTTVARQMGGILKAVGILEQGHVIERRASDYLHNPDRFDDDLKQARHGILFIDEAHQMRNSDGGQEVIRRLLTALEDPNVLRNTSIILAGYPMEMTQLLEFDPGLKSRFGTDSSMITFPDYTETEMLSIMRDMARKAKGNPQIAAPRNLTLSDEYCDLSRMIFSEICAQRDPRFGNARFVRNYLNDSVDCLLERLDEEEEIDYHLTAEDIPPRFSKYKPATDKSKPAPLLPATLVKGLISTEPVKELITDRMMRHYTPNFTVYLEASKNGQPYGSGTGTIISKEGHILTCEHVVDGADRIRARVYAPGTIGGDYHWFNCQVLHPTAKDIDMALLKMDGSNFPAATLRPEGAPIDECERILLSGFPLGSQLSDYDAENLRISHFFGNISSIQHRETETVFADITGLQGNSGSPVFSMDDGRVIGVFTGSVTHKSEQLTEENNYFHPIQLFWERFTVDLS